MAEPTAELRRQPIHPVVLVLLVSSSILVAAMGELSPTARSLVVVLYLLLAPGYALLPSFGVGHRLLHGLLALTASVAVGVALATAMSMSGVWHPEAAARVTVGLVLAAAAWRAGRDRAELAAFLNRGAR